MDGIRIDDSKVNPGYPAVDSIEETIRVRRKITLEQAEFERKLAELRSGLVSVKEIQLKQTILWSAAGIVFIVLSCLVYYLFKINQYMFGTIVTFFLIIYVLAFFALHDANIRKIILSTKDIKMEK